MKIYRARYLLPIAAPPLEDGALLVEGGRVAAVAPFAELRRAEAEVLDFGEAILLPPLVNAHTHLELSLFPRWAAEAGEYAHPTSFVDWILKVVRVKKQLPEAAFAAAIESGIEACLRSGTGAVGDIISWYPARTAHHASPLLGVLFLEVLGRDFLTMRQHFGRALDLLGERQAGHLRLGLSPHSPYTIASTYLEQLLEAAHRRELRLAIHLAESPAECEFLLHSRGPLVEELFPRVGWQDLVPPPAGCSPFRYLSARGELGEKTLLIHGVHVNGGEAEAIAASGATVVLCPRSNASLGVGKAPLARYLEAGVRLALGTDSLASVDSLSVWDELAFARRDFMGEIAPRGLLSLATACGARALGLEGEMGTLAPGTGVHFQVLQPADLPSLCELEEFLCSPGRTPELRNLVLHGRDVLQ